MISMSVNAKPDATSARDSGVCIKRVENHLGPAYTGGVHAVELAQAGRVGRLGDEPQPTSRHRSLYGRGRAVRDDRPFADDDDAVGHGVGLVEVMGREDDCAPLPGKTAHHGPERPPTLNVHGDRRLVQEDEVGITGDGECEANPLGLPTREPLGLAIGKVAEPRVG